MNRWYVFSGRILQTARILPLAVLFACGGAFAQGVTGSFTGAVKDSSGAVVPNALVKVRSVDSGREWQNVGNESGIYYVSALPPGQYSLTVEVPGFKRLVTNVITLEVNQTARVDLALEVGAVAETVEVKDVAPLLQTDGLKGVLLTRGGNRKSE